MSEQRSLESDAGVVSDAEPPVPEDSGARGFLASLGVELDESLAQHALTHRSFAYENGGIPDNERLEFLGDAVLGQAVTITLFREFPDLDEGQLAKRRASLVSTVALAEIARRIGLGEHIKLGRGETLSGGAEKASILADAVEAMIGAVFVGAGPEQATAFVLRLVRPLMDDVDRFGAAMDPKTSLQELAAARGLPAPSYAVTGDGPDHDRSYSAVVTVGSAVRAEGTGTSKKHAELAAALDAWTELSAQPQKPATPPKSAGPTTAQRR